jgi:hypothetical protein
VAVAVTRLRDVLGLTERGEYRWSELATYNSERARGLVHTEEWKARMAKQQEEFNEWARTQNEAGIRVVRS